MNEYTNVGMDVHARSVACKALRPETGECWSSTFGGEGREHELLAWLKKLPGPVRCAYESGCTGFWLSRFLEDEGISCDVMDVRAYMKTVLDAFVAGIYADRDFCRSALRGPCAYRIATDTAMMLDETMRDHVMGSQFAPAGTAAEDRRYAIAAGVVSMVIRWFESDFAGENAPAAMARRLLDTMFSLAGVAD